MNNKKNVSLRWLAACFSITPALFLVLKGPTNYALAAPSTSASPNQRLGKVFKKDVVQNLADIMPAGPKDKIFVTPGTLQVLGELSCGDQDVADFIYGNPAVTPSPIPPHNIDMVYYYPDPWTAYSSQIHGVLGYWIVPNPTSSASVSRQTPVNGNPAAPNPGTGEWIPIAWNTLPYNNVIVNPYPTPSASVVPLSPPLTKMYEVNRPSTLTFPTQLLRNRFYTLFNYVAPNAHNMAAGPVSAGGYNVYTAFMGCTNNYGYPTGAGTAGTTGTGPTEQMANDALVNPDVGLRKQLDGQSLTQLRDWAAIGFSIQPPAPSPRSPSVAPTVTPLPLYFAGPTTPTPSPIPSTNTLYGLAKDLKANFDDVGSPGPMPSPTPAIPSGPLYQALTTSGTGLFARLNAIYNVMKTSTSCYSLAGEMKRWYEPFPTQFTCGQLDRTDSGIRGGFIADYEALFTSSGAPQGSLATAVNSLYDGGMNTSSFIAAIDKLEADLLSAAVMQDAQNRLHNQFVGTAPTVSCFGASPVIKDLLISIPIPMHRKYQGDDILNLVAIPSPSPSPATLALLNPNNSLHPEGSFALGSPSVYNGIYSVTSTDPMTGTSVADSKAFFAMNAPIYDTTVMIDPIRGTGTSANDVVQLALTFAPGQPTGGLTVQAPYLSNPIRDPLPAPEVDINLDKNTGLLILFNVRALSPYGPNGCGKMYCSVPDLKMPWDGWVSKGSFH